MFSIVQKPENKTVDRESSRQTVKPSRRYSTVALIGLDGSGKSSVAKALIANCPIDLKYLYMGTSIESSNYALPTSRLIHWWKVRQHRKSLIQSGAPVPDKIHLHGREHRVDKRGRMGGVIRLARRVSEEIYRQLVSWIFQMRGNVVLYDRHFLFDACPAPGEGTDHRLTDRLHYWFLRKLYPRPGLAIFLDAPAEVLLERKQEVPLEFLRNERSKLLKKRAYAQTFVIIDTTQPIEEVVESVTRIILENCQ